MRHLLPIAITAALALPAGYVVGDITADDANAKLSPNQVQFEQLQALKEIRRTSSRQARGLEELDDRLAAIERKLTGGLSPGRPIGDLTNDILEELRRR